MIRCSICKRFVKNITYITNYNDDILEVNGDCKRCGSVKCDWDCYEDLVGYGGYNKC